MTAKLRLFAALSSLAGATVMTQSRAEANTCKDQKEPVRIEIREQPYRELVKVRRVLPLVAPPAGDRCAPLYPPDSARFN